MTLPFLDLPVLRDSYTISRINDKYESMVDGGFPVSRKNILDAPKQVSITLILDWYEYEVFMSFYRRHLENATQRFTMNLQVDNYQLLEHELYMIGTPQESRQESMRVIQFDALVKSEPYQIITGVDFDGTNAYLDELVTNSGSYWSGKDGKILSFATRIDFDVNVTGTVERFVSENLGYIQFDRVASTGQLSFLVNDSGGTTRLNVITTNNVAANAGSYRILLCLDMTDVNKLKLYVNDVLQAMTVTTYANNNLDWTTGEFAVGAAYNGGSTKINGKIGFFYWNITEYIDFGTLANRRKFFDNLGGYKNLGADGSKPTGTSPAIFLWGNKDEFYINKGAGGGQFRVNGTLTSVVGTNYNTTQYDTDLLTIVETYGVNSQELKDFLADYVV